MGQLANCERCGNVFVKTVRDICEPCRKEEDKLFERVHTYIRKKEHRMASLSEVVEATGVEEATITKFIREGRLLLSRFPNLGYPCRKCGTIIREGKLCKDCSESLKKDLEQHEKQENLEREKELREKQVTYYSMDEKFRRN